ncbi:hypothetical protein HMPREF9946_03641 [Acetobacteraceae bacterium AT-5844]|nr:hypothetical protein HMPREF9946_03641 [Acetobacteraceae bacterium AT-5844]
MRSISRLLVLIAAGAGLAGCVAYPAGYYGPPPRPHGYYYAPPPPPPPRPPPRYWYGPPRW